MEQWKNCYGIEGYEVSDLGRVRSVSKKIIRSNGRSHTVKGKVLSVSTDTQGYGQFHPYVSPGKRRSILVHRAVFEAFVRPLEPGEQVDHQDSNKLNNQLVNLQAVKNNIEHWQFTKERMEKKWYDEGYSAGFADGYECGKKYGKMSVNKL